MRGSGTPATSSAAATRRRTGSSAPSSSSATTCPSTCGAASSPSRARSARGCASPGPGPYITRDIDDVGFMSISVKLMGVPGPKLLDDEQDTQDMFGVSTPTFVTPDTSANAQLQHWSYKNAPIFYFVNFREPHILDSVMQLLWTKTQTSPLEDEYFSCVPYLLGEGQAMQYSFRHAAGDADARAAAAAAAARQLPPRRDGGDARRAGRRVRRPAPGADRPAPDADREQRASSGRRSCRRACRPPCSGSRGRRSTRPSSSRSRACSRTTRGTRSPEHRPLGNQSRARKRMYYELSRLRQQMNAVEHYEPTGDEAFPARPIPRGSAARRGRAGRSRRRR